ncbi:MAG: hypothetical protein QF398_15220, partial [Alphaproteobacteria bacterium]|nr:hypothetical protein [Alphaproteobacteria bacterium]
MTITRTTCRMCLVRCGMLVETGDEPDAESRPEGALANAEPGQALRVTGDREHPLSKGFLCPKGKFSIDMTTSPKRLLYPQKRIGERGSGQWQRVSWEQA